ncbi:MAG: hypothetical protein VW390_02340 [Gammaproteobacteria bacterium]
MACSGAEYFLYGARSLERWAFLAGAASADPNNESKERLKVTN